jgi:hypothetical protein
MRESSCRRVGSATTRSRAAVRSASSRERASSGEIPVQVGAEIVVGAVVIPTG